MAERLNRQCGVCIKEAEEAAEEAEEEHIVAGVAYLAPAGRHLKLKRCGRELHIRFDCSPESALHRPSVDALFESAAAVCENKCLAFVLTGMGRDGSVGARALKNAGSRVVAESEETCRVFGMPKAVGETMKVDASVPLYDISDTMLKMI